MSDNLLEKQISEIMNAVQELPGPQPSLAGKKAQKVAYLGPEFSHSFEAAAESFPDTMLDPYSSFRAIFEAIYEEKVAYGIVPVENSISGSVFESLHELFEWTDKDELKRIVAFGEHTMYIKNFIASKRQISLKNIEIILTKDVVYRQCSEWLKFNQLDTLVRYAASSADAAIQANKDIEGKIAAICSYSAVIEYGLQLLEPSSITDDPTNSTRFLKLKTPCVSLPSNHSNNDNRVTLFFAVIQDTPGALYKILRLLSKFNLRDITKAPIPHKWRLSPEFKHWFLFEFEAKLSDNNFVTALKQLRRRTDLVHFIKVVGSFPSKHPDTFIPVSY